MEKNEANAYDDDDDDLGKPGVGGVGVGVTLGGSSSRATANRDNKEVGKSTPRKEEEEEEEEDYYNYSDREDNGGLAVAMAVGRRKRKPRRRRSSSSLFNLLLLPPAFSSSVPSHARPPPPARGIDPTTLRFLFEKELQASDVGALRRMIVPKKAAESYLPILTDKEGLFISMNDMDGVHVWSFKFRYWPNNTSRMYVLENTGEFVGTHGLKQGDYMMLYQDDRNQKYVIRARKAWEEEEEEEDLSTTDHDSAVLVSDNNSNKGANDQYDDDEEEEEEE
ncbi:B3 domain-containing transcription factor FUS3, partial [Diospyros lotus]|uniref:B3 domain-containing transcription factor FUS3 n=1 Tax=Diospyros lotus TaxID=55363 RepID=UPI002257C8B8